MKLPLSYYLGENVVEIARDLIGKVLVSSVDGMLIRGVITETEAYNGIVDKASHAFGGRRTSRNEVMYGDGGKAYVYLCYGIHHLFNIVTNTSGTPHAILIRGIVPFSAADKEMMMERRGKNNLSLRDNFGPGKVTQSLGIRTLHSGIDLMENTIWLENVSEVKLDLRKLKTGPRIGVDYAGEDARLPYRFYFEGNNPY